MIYNYENSNCLNTDPCGTPLITDFQLDSFPFADTHCCLPVRYDLTQKTTVSHFNKQQRMINTKKSFEKSNQDRLWPNNGRTNGIRDFMEGSSLVVLWRGRKPDWKFESKPLPLMNENICWCTAPSRHFDRAQRKLTGLKSGGRRGELVFFNGNTTADSHKEESIEERD